MRLVFVTRHAPWLEREGAHIRNAALLRDLSARTDLQIVFMPSANKGHEAPPASFPYVLHHIPFDAQQRPAARALVHALAPDIIWHSWKFSILALGTVPQIPTVLDMVDVLWLNTRRTAAQRRGVRRLRAQLNSYYHRFEDSVAARMADVVVLSNPVENSLLWTARPVVALPNGMDFAAHCPPYEPTSPRLILLGNFLNAPNRDGAEWFFHAVWSCLRAQAPLARLELIGQGSASLPFAASENVKAHGYIDDLEPLVQNAALILSPIRIGSGTRTKVLYGWAHGLPVVSTVLGAEGLDARDDDNILLADDAEAFARACARILAAPALGARLAANGFAHGKANYDWRALSPRLGEILGAAMRSHHAP